jgi:predicted Zn-dependent protease
VGQKKNDQVLQVWKTELALNPDDRELRSNFAEVAYETRAFDEAAEQYRWLCKMEPGTALFHKRLGQALLMGNDVSGALTALDRALALNPSDSEVALSIAYAQERAGHLPDAIQQYRRALAQRPDDYRLANNLANALANADTNLDEAFALAQKAREKSSSDPIVLDTVGVIYLKKKMPGNALPIFESLVHRFPDTYIYRYHFAQALLATGKTADAKRELVAALHFDAPPLEKQAMQSLLQGL